VITVSKRTVVPMVARYLVGCFRAGRSPHIGELAGQLNLTPLALSRLFFAATGRRLGPFLRVQQVLRARRLLRWLALPLADVARRSGYERERTFYRAFRRVTGTTPLRFREEALAVTHRSCRCPIGC
jgi:AraC-like DNA-binding protein